MNIIYEDNHIIAVNKTNSDIIHSDKTGDRSLEDEVKDYIKKKYNKPGDVFLGVVHRIDRPVSGVVLFARTSKALTRLNQLFKDKDIKKTYWAIVKELPPQDEGELIHYISRDERNNKSHAHLKPRKDAKEAIMEYRLIGSTSNYHFLEINLKTGRHHQIRVQLSQIGCPIRGDLKYGFPRSNKEGGISLHARQLEFIHPVKKEPVKLVANPPRDALWDVVKELVI